MACVLCGQPIQIEWTLTKIFTLTKVRAPHLCRACLRQFTRIDQANACPGCGRADSPTLCYDCQRWQKAGYPLLHHRAVFQYDGAMKSFIQQYKGLGDWRLHVAFQDLIQPPKSTYVPIPTEAGHYQARGFDPVLGLFDHLSLHQWLEKADTPVPQAQKNRAGRLMTPQSFSVRPLVSLAQISQITLLDDLYTTGRTLYHAADALREAGFHGTITSFSLIR
ncbi:ComF family protein [Lacticaseibacillus porcinae]|uniref:ComF family protein n=1 Tax=Lacticaseibacillus porcinae TaxID=1123687 RepID=UPI001CDCC62F|nr:ComF family protein [Lacticaseibacillus porcinae]